MLKNIAKHIALVSKHKWVVFKLCCRVGIPIRGLLHDLSKFSPTEFWESVKYYNGKKSPIIVSREINGYSKAWLHHQGRNKHHYQYWVDFTAKEPAILIPYKYTAEMICDKVAAGIVYEGKNWTPDVELKYWQKERSQGIIINPKIDNLLIEVFTQISENGLEKTLTKKNIQKLYTQYCGQIKIKKD